MNAKCNEIIDVVVFFLIAYGALALLALFMSVES